MNVGLTTRCGFLIFNKLASCGGTPMTGVGSDIGPPYTFLIIGIIQDVHIIFCIIY